MQTFFLVFGYMGELSEFAGKIGLATSERKHRGDFFKKQILKCAGFEFVGKMN